MARGYETAFRERVVRAAQTSSARKAAARFDIGVATAIRWARQFRETGSVEERVPARKGSILDPHRDFLHGLRDATPHLSCQEMAERLAEERGVKVHETTVWYWLRREGITFKKNAVRD